MPSILIATHNPAKLAELTAAIRSTYPSLTISSLRDLNITLAPEETGASFLENARLKARYYAQVSGMPTLADDGGLEIDALNGEPGVKSNRWLGRSSTDEELIAYCIERMQNVPKSKRSARFVTTLYFIDPVSNTEAAAQASVDGTISEIAVEKRQLGYPYRSVFTVSKFEKNYLDLSPEEHREVNHRYRAVNDLLEKLKSWYN